MHLPQKMLALLALATPAVAYYDGPRGYCSPFTARYLTLIDDVLVFHGGQGYMRYNTTRVQRFLFPTNTSGRISTPGAITEITCPLCEGEIRGISTRLNTL